MRKKQEKRVRRHKRVRAKAFGTNKRPRLCVFKSSKHIYAQLIDDEKGKTITAASDSELQPKTKKGKSKVAVACEVGKLIAKKALGKKFAEPSAHLTPRSALQSSAIEEVEKVPKVEKPRLRPEVEAPKPKIEKGIKRIFRRKAF